MSVEAYTWALNLAPVPMDPGKVYKGQQRDANPSSACAFVLVALANHANPDGTDAFPSVGTIVRYTRLSIRTVRTCLDRLEAAGVIVAGDAAVVAAKIKRADHRPKNYDLNYAAMRDDLTDAQLDKVGADNPWLKPWIDQRRRGATIASPAVTGCNGGGDGVQPLPPRGAMVAPEPSFEPSPEPSSDDDAGQPALSLLSVVGAAPKPEDGFEEFWAVYPRHDKGVDARKAWAKAVKTTPASVIIEDVRRRLPWFELQRKPSGDFRPHPASWLRGERWNDEVERPKRASSDGYWG